MPLRWSKAARAIHWIIAICVLLNLFILEDAAHEYAGYTAFGVVLLQLLYKFLHRPHSYPNKVAMLIYYCIWTLILALGITGHMNTLDAYWGEDWLEEIHELLANTLRALVFLHLAGIAVDSFHNKRKTWLNMFNGKQNL